jgi:aarF domain-containing kinase
LLQNILKLNQPTAEGHTVALIDCGLMANVDKADQDHMISAVIHLANKDYASLVDDFIRLNILPTDCDRAAIIPLMDKALSPYVKGGGAKKYEEELKKMYGMEEESMSSQVGGFQAMTQDALTVLNDIPFSIPPYFAILGRAIVTLEGIALTGNEDYGIIMESYPFIARKLLSENRPEIQQALQEVLFSVGDSSSPGLRLNRLLALLNNASGAVGTKEGAAFVDLDAIPEDGLSLGDGFKLLLSENAESVRKLLEEEVENIAWIFFRQIVRKGMTEAVVTLTPPRLPSLPFIGDIISPPKLQLDDIPIPFLLPGEEITSTPFVSLMTANQFTDLIAPKLTRDEEIYAISISDAAEEFLGPNVANLLRGDDLISTQSASLVLAAASTGLLGNKDLLGTQNAQNVIRTVSSLLKRLDSKAGGIIDEALADITAKLSDDEKERLDEIVTELTQRTLTKVRSRAATRQ